MNEQQANIQTDKKNINNTETTFINKPIKEQGKQSILNTTNEFGFIKNRQSN